MALNDEFLGAGWSFPLDVDGRGGISLARGDRDVAEAIYIILGTAPGERRMRPEFGCRIHELIFAPMNSSTGSLMRHYVIEALNRWEPRIEVSEVRVYRHPQIDGAVLIEVDYVLLATNDERNLVFPFYRIPEHA
jgi:phage baseplate assembly protein W